MMPPKMPPKHETKQPTLVAASVAAEIWHNPRCITSKKTLDLLRQQGVEPKIVLYLETPPNKTRLKEVLKLAGLKAPQLLRKKEADAKALLARTLSDEDALEAMLNNPILIERPMVIVGTRAALGRPPESVLDLLR